MGHFAKDCRADKKVEGTTNIALEGVTNEGLLLMAQNDDNINNDTLWYLDSGATNHMCGDEYLFKEMQKIEDGHVSFEDDHVYYVPDLKTNILSMGNSKRKVTRYS